MLFFIFGGLAMASAPDRVASEISVGSGDVHRLESGLEGGLVTAVSDSSLHLLDVASWEAQSVAPCSVTGSAMIEWDSVSVDVWVSCSDGTLRPMQWAEGVLYDYVDYEDQLVSYVVGESALFGVWADDTQSTLYALEDDVSQPILHSIDPWTGGVDEVPGYPIALVYDGFVEGVVSAGALFVAHGSSDMSKIILGTTTGTYNLESLSVSIEDITPSPNGGVFAIDSGGYLVEFQSTTSTYAINMNDLVDPTAVSTSLEEGWAVIARVGGGSVWTLNSGLIDVTKPVLEFESEATVIDIVAGADGYWFGGTEAGTLAVITANPWVSDLLASPDVAALGDEISVTFLVDVDADYVISVEGIEVASGSGVAGQQVTAAVVVGDTWVEGDNVIEVSVVDGQLNEGHATTSVNVDNPPSIPLLMASSVGFADEGLILNFDGIDDEDLSHYVIYVSQTSFEPSAFKSGGPVYDGNTALEAPITIEAEPSTAVTYEITPLENYVTYYVAVRAHDSGGLEGEMSSVISGTPMPTFSASELAGEQGGCANAGGPSGAIVLLFSSLLVWRRRALPVAVCLLAMNPSSAQADDLTSAWSSFDIVVGQLSYTEDDSLQSVYGEEPHNVFAVEFGPQLFRMLEIDLGVSYAAVDGYTVNEFGVPSAEASRMSELLLTGGLTFRGHFFDEQWVVPFYRLGKSRLIWQETWDGTEMLGEKDGVYTGYGVNIMLDTFDPGRASLLESQTGINDTYITVEQYQVVFADDVAGLRFDQLGIRVGLKFDY